MIDRCSSGIRADAPLVLVGGGSKGETWRQVVQAMSGRTVQIPETVELVALGAAAQAGAMLGGERPEEVARRGTPGEGRFSLRCRATMKPGTASAERVD